jgi:hypothetical protein
MKDDKGRQNENALIALQGRRGTVITFESMAPKKIETADWKLTPLHSFVLRTPTIARTYPKLFQGSTSKSEPLAPEDEAIATMETS